MDLVGTWRLAYWKRIEGETVTFPLPEGAVGLLIYAQDGTMAVQMVARDRPPIATKDALGGDPAEAHGRVLDVSGLFRHVRDRG